MWLVTAACEVHIIGINSHSEQIMIDSELKSYIHNARIPFGISNETLRKYIRTPYIRMELIVF